MRKKLPWVVVPLGLVIGLYGFGLHVHRFEYMTFEQFALMTFATYAVALMVAIIRSDRT